MKKLLAALVGFVIVFVVFAVGREVYWAFLLGPAAEVIGSAFDAVGSLRWIDTTLVTGLAAVVAAVVSVRAVREQIEQSERTSQQQLQQTERIEQDRIAAKRAAARAVLPLTLSALCGYAEEAASALMTLRSRCVGGALPSTVAIPNFPSLPEGVIPDLKEMVEFLGGPDRTPFTKLIVDIQVQQTRMLGIESDRRRRRNEMRLNLEVYIGDAAKIYARASALFDYARGETQDVPTTISSRDALTAVHMVGVYEQDLEAELSARIHRQINRDQ